MPIQPIPCATCGGPVEGPEFEHNSVVLCDTLPDGTVVAAVILVQEYDEVTGLPVGAPVPTDPSTGLPYVVQGVLKACASAGCGPVTSDLLCDNTADGVYTPYIHTQVFNCDGTLAFSANFDLTGAGYIPLGIPGACPDNEPQFAGLVCDVFGGSPAVPAVPPSCPGGALGAANLIVGSGMTEGPAGTYTQTANVNAQIVWNNIPSDDQHAICSVRFVNDASTGNNPLWQVGGQFVDGNNNPQSLDPIWITAIETALGVGELSDIPPGSSATASVGGTAVTITFDGPSPHSQMWAGNGAFFVREQDGDGLAAGVTLDFSPPIKNFSVILNNAAGDPGTLSGLQQANATPGTAAIPAQPAGVFEVKQFRNADGTAFYENLDGTLHAVLGTVGECGNYLSEQLCDATGAPFVRVYTITTGTVTSVQDYTLGGVTFAAVEPVGRCSETLATFRHTPPEVLCYTASPSGVVTQFLRRYIINQDGINVVAVIDTLLDGVTPFVAVVGGTVAQCDAASPCNTKSSIGTICYIPPPTAAPGVSVRGQMGSADGAVESPLGTVTLANFQGSGVDVVITNSNPANFSVTPMAIDMPGAGPDTITLTFSQPVIVTALQTGDMDQLAGGEFWDTFSIPVLGVTGTLVESPPGSVHGTVINANPDGDIQFNSTVTSFSYVRHSAGGSENMRQLAFTTLVSVIDTTVGTAAVLVDCETGAVSYVGLATGLPLDISTVTIVDCTTTAGDDTEVLILCDSTPTQFLRALVYDSSGVIVGFTDTALDGTTPFAPVGAVGVCTAASAAIVTRDVEVVTLFDCPSGVAFQRRLTYNGQTGAFISALDTQLNGTTPYVVVGTAAISCSTPVAAITVASDAFSAVPGTPWTSAAIPVGRRLTSLTFTVLSGTATLTDATGPTVIAGIPTGYTGTWSVAADNETLTPPQSIASVGGSVLVLMSTAL